MHAPRKIDDCVRHGLEGAAEEFVARAREIHGTASECYRASHDFLTSLGAHLAN